MPKNCLIKPDENDFKIEGYNLYTNIKEFPDWRGTGLYIHKSIKAKESTFSFNKGYLESVWAEVYLSETEVLLCGIVYKSQKEKDNVLLKELFSNVSFLNTYTHLLVMGDFNFPDINWENWSSSDSNSQEVIEIIQDTYLQQHVTQPIRYRAGQTSNCLDLIFTNEEEMIQQVQISDPLGLSDHCILVFDLITHYSFNETMPNSQKKFIFDKGDFDSMKQELSQINWEKEMRGLSVNELMAYIESKINYCIEKYIPSYSQNFFGENKKPQPLWMNKKALKLIKKKHNAYRRWLNTHEGRNYEKYKRLSNKVKSITRKLTKAFEKRLAKKIEETPKAHWKYVNSKRKCKININSLLSPDGIITEDDIEKVDILNTFFTSVFTKEDLYDIPEFNANYNGHCIRNIQFSEKDIEEILKALKVTNSPRPDK